MIRSLSARLACTVLAGVYLIRAASGVWAQGAYQRGLGEVADGRYRDAVESLTQAMRGGGASVEAIWSCGDARLNMHDLLERDAATAAQARPLLAESARDFLEGLAIVPASGWYYDGLSGVYLRRERAARAARTLDFSVIATAAPWSLVGDDGRVALGLLRLAIDRAGATAPFRDDLVLALAENGLMDEAKAAVGESAKVLPDFAAHDAFAGDALSPELLEAFYRVSRASVGAAPLQDRERQLLGLSRLGRRLGHAAEAEADFRAALAAPATSLAHAEDAYHLAMMLIDLGRPDDAAAPLSAAEREPVFVSNVLQARGRIAENRGRLDEALRLYDQARRMEPRRVDMWLGYADVARRLGKTAQAGEALRWVIIIAPRDPLPRVRLAELYIGARDRLTAATVIAELRGIVGDSADVVRLEKALSSLP